MTEIQKMLFALGEEKYKAFSSKLNPTLDAKTIIGVRMPKLRELAKTLQKEAPEMIAGFFAELPHKYHEENNLHGYLIMQIKDIDRCLEELEKFLPYIDNWATCDSTAPAVFKKHPALLRRKATEWMRSAHEYTVRYGIGLLLSNYLKEHFDPQDLKEVSELTTGVYYIDMMIAWYFSMALAHQYESAIGYIEKRALAHFVHQKTIQKAVESRQISDERKAHLKSLRY